MPQTTQYTEDNIRSLDWKEHIRMRPGMYIGKLGDGSSADDGIYILLKEVLDNSIDEFVMGAGKTIEISVKEGQVTVRDYGRGIPLGKWSMCFPHEYWGKYDTRALKICWTQRRRNKAVNACQPILRWSLYEMINPKLPYLSVENSSKTPHKNRAANAKEPPFLLCLMKASLSTIDIVMSTLCVCSSICVLNPD